MAEGEVFDSNLLKDTVNAEISQGNRNFSLDLTALDYVYSDTINVLLALNKRVLDVSGRMSLLGPGPEVMQILKRTGVHNILKIYDTEDDLQKSSEDIILQTSSFRLSDIKGFAQQGDAPAPPQSEFEDLRSEIGSAMPGQGGGISDTARFRAGQQQQPPPVQPGYPPQQQAYSPQKPVPAAGDTDRFRMAPPPPPPPAYEPEFQVASPQPSPYQQQPPQQQYYQQPPAQQMPPPPYPPQGFEQQQPPQQQQFYQQQQPAQGYPQPQPMQQMPTQQPFDLPQAPAPQEQFQQKRPAVSELDRFVQSEEGDSEHKSILVPVLVTIITIVVVLGGAIFGFKMYLDSSKKEQALPEVSPPSAQVATPAPAVTEQPAPAIETPAPVPTPVPEPKKEPAAVKEPSKPAPKPVPAPKPEPRKPAPVVQQRTPPPPPPPAAPPAGKAKLTINSSPSGALVKIDGRVVGTTPVSVDNPVYGAISIAVSKGGYQESSKTVEYMGGVVNEFFSLDQQEAAAPPPPPPPPPRAEPRPEPVAPPPPPAPAPVAAPAPAPSAPASSASADEGEPATIFVSSLPPVSDVYMDGKLIGKTNVSELKVKSGTHSMRFVKGDREVSQQMTFQPGRNPSQVIRLP